jgi:ankyrin repeat protein
MSLLPPPPQDDDPIITEFKPEHGQWELTEDNINRIDPTTGETILHNYCKRINITPLEVYRYLIETKGCDINLHDKYKHSSLMYALSYFKSDDITVLMYLLTQENVNVNTKGWNGETLLHTVCRKINQVLLDVFKLLIEAYGADVNAQDDDKNTPIHNALRQFRPINDVDITVLIYLLTQKTFNVDIKSYSGHTFLHAACININSLPIDIFKVLIETHGADVNAQDDDNNTPLHYALYCFNPNDACDITVLDYLLGQENFNLDTKTLLHYACANINALPIDVFKFLIQKMSCDVNVQDKDNDTPIHRAMCRFNSNDGGDITVLMYLLIQKGVNTNTKGRHGYSLLHYACESINTLTLEIFKFLIEKLGADVNVQANNKNTPLHRALDRFNPNDGGDINVLTYLINQKNVNVNINGSSGRTLLHLACICNIPDLNDYIYSDDDYMDSEDDLNDLDDSNNSVKAKADDILCQIIEMIVETCLGQIIDETTS